MKVPRPTLSAIPHEIASASDYEKFAPEFIDEATFAYISGGCGNEETLHNNVQAFRRYNLQQRLMRDIKNGSCAQSLLGNKLKHPIILGPVAHQKLVHPQGELASAAAASAMDSVFVTSTLSHTKLETVATKTNYTKWFQLYFQPDQAITLDILNRAELAGYQAIVVTLDVPINGLRYKAQRAGFSMPEHLSEENLAGYPVSAPIELDQQQSIVFDGLMQQAPNWKDLEWLRKQTHLPILIKGVNHPADAKQARSLGIDGLIVSNHGGRSLDGLPASLDTLPKIRKQVGANYPLLFDGGIRSGGDIFKAIALGANAVMIGRLQIYALAVAGALGVAHMLRTLKSELEVTMALAGCEHITDITQENLYRN